MQNAGLGSWEPLVTTFLVTQSIRDLVVCVFLLKETLLNIFLDSLPLNSWPAAPQRSLNDAHLTHVGTFSIKHITAFLLSGAQESTSPLWLGSPFNNKITHKELKNAETMPLKRPWEGRWSTARELIPEGRASPGSTSVSSSGIWGSVKVSEWPQRCWELWFGGHT